MTRKVKAKGEDRKSSKWTNKTLWTSASCCRYKLVRSINILIETDNLISIIGIEKGTQLLLYRPVLRAKLTVARKKIYPLFAYAKLGKYSRLQVAIRKFFRRKVVALKYIQASNKFAAFTP